MTYWGDAHGQCWMDARGNLMPKYVCAPDGPRPHRHGDNQGAVIYTYPAYQRDRRGTTAVVSGFFDHDWQKWRMWDFPHIFHTDFFDRVCREIGGKPVGHWEWVKNSDWDVVSPHQLRADGYHSPEEDYTARNYLPYYGKPRAEWEDGCAEGYAAGIGAATGNTAQDDADNEATEGKGEKGGSKNAKKQRERRARARRAASSTD